MTCALFFFPLVPTSFCLSGSNPTDSKHRDSKFSDGLNKEFSPEEVHTDTGFDSATGLTPHVNAASQAPASTQANAFSQAIALLGEKNTEARSHIQAAEPWGFAATTQDIDIACLFALRPVVTGALAREFLSVTSHGRIARWNLNTEEESELFPAAGVISACAYDPNRHLVAMAEETSVSLFDIQRRVKISTSPSFGTKSSSLEFQPDGNSLIVGGEDGKVYRWRLTPQDESDPRKRIEIERYLGHSAAVSALAYHPFSRIFFSGDSFGGIATWLSYDKDLFGGKYDERTNQVTYFAEDAPRALVASSEASTVLLLRVSNDGQNLFSALQDGSVEWRLVRGLRLVVLAKANQGAIYDMQISPSGRLLATVARDGIVRVFELVTLAKQGQVEEGKKIVPEFNTFKKDSLGYLKILKEFPLENARKLLFLSENTLVVGENQGRLLELKL